MIELHHALVSTCSQRVRMALHEKGLPWVDRALSLRDGEHLRPEYLAINPNGVVPAIVHDGHVVADSTVILEYLDDAFPDTALRPREPLALARMRMWQQYIDEVPTPATRVPSFHFAFGRALRALDRPAREAHAARRPLRRDFYLRMGEDGFPQAELDAAMRQLRQALDRAETALARTPWLAGERLTHADISLLPTVVRLEDLALGQPFEHRPQLARWYAALQARPSFAAAYGPGSRDL